VATHVNFTPFATLAFDTLDHRDREYQVAMIRATCDITKDFELRPAAEQTPAAAVDDYFVEPTLSSLRQESDLAPYKPRCDILLEATAYAPKGAPAPGWPVDIRVGTHRKRLLVTGPRRWQHRLFGGWKTSLPELIASLPLRYEHAYGGQVTRYDPESGREHTEHCPHNPLGVGYWPPWAHREAKRRGQVPVPQIFAVEDVQPEFGRPLRVQGVGPIGKTWLPRMDLAGTYDQPWQAGRWPGLPEDFDFGFWNCAHPELQIPYLAGNERVELYNLTPAGRLDFQLPGYRPFILVRYRNGEVKTARANLDTLFIAPDDRRVSLVWWATVLAEPPVRILESRLPTEGWT